VPLAPPTCAVICCICGPPIPRPTAISSPRAPYCTAAAAASSGATAPSHRSWRPSSRLARPTSRPPVRPAAPTAPRSGNCGSPGADGTAVGDPSPGPAQNEWVRGISVGIVSLEMLQAAQEADLARVRIAQEQRWASSNAASGAVMSEGGSQPGGSLCGPCGRVSDGRHLPRPD
jgi:hypothetical protein